MKQITLLRIAVPVPLRKTLDYLLPDTLDSQQLKPGIRIKVPLGKREVIGLLIELTTTDAPDKKLKPIINILDNAPLFSKDMLSLCAWASNYYHHPIGDVMLNALPPLLRKGRKTSEADATPHANQQNHTKIKQQPPSLTSAQEKAINDVMRHKHQFKCFVLDGVTGSGKTEVYLQIIHDTLKQNKQALVLIPEISLTPQTLSRFEQRFNAPIVSFHSGLTEKERLTAWLKAKSGEAKIIIGTRSAIFTPCPNLGVIIIDEEHDLSYKQQEKFRYSAKNIAIMRAHSENIPIILGSATPSFETLYNVEKKRFSYLQLPERVGNAIHPHYHLVNIRGEKLEQGLSQELLTAIGQHLHQNNQVLLFLNRRGYAPTLACHECGWIATCPRCDIHMTLHRAPYQLRCHHCDTVKPVPTTCPTCREKKLKPLGIGTERLEEALEKHFPSIPIIRIDRDTTRKKNALNAMVTEIMQGNRQILIGTQMLAKGHHFPHVTLVGILNADSGFFSSDFRATERSAQLLIQVAGRAGRAEKPGEVFIQTLYPKHPLLLQLIQKGYHDFSLTALQERQESLLPPYSYFALLHAEAIKQSLPTQFLEQVRTIAETINHESVYILGPMPSPIQRRKSHYRVQLLFQSASRKNLQDFLSRLIPKIDELKTSKKVKWAIDIDPLEMG